jgi:hypothetical protein
MDAVYGPPELYPKVSLQHKPLTCAEMRDELERIDQAYPDAA